MEVWRQKIRAEIHGRSCFAFVMQDIIIKKKIKEKKDERAEKVLQKLRSYSVKELRNIWNGALSLIEHHIVSATTKHLKGKLRHSLRRCARLAQREHQAQTSFQVSRVSLEMTNGTVKC